MITLARRINFNQNATRIERNVGIPLSTNPWNRPAREINTTTRWLPHEETAAGFKLRAYSQMNYANVSHMIWEENEHTRNSKYEKDET